MVASNSLPPNPSISNFDDPIQTPPPSPPYDPGCVDVGSGKWEQPPHPSPKPSHLSSHGTDHALQCPGLDPTSHGPSTFGLFPQKLRRFPTFHIPNPNIAHTTSLFCLSKAKPSQKLTGFLWEMGIFNFLSQIPRTGEISIRQFNVNQNLVLVCVLKRSVSPPLLISLLFQNP